MRYTKRQFEAEYPNDDACLEAVFQNRFGDLKFCPKCGAETNFYRIKKRQAYACQWCAYQLHPLADTIFRKTTTPLTLWFYAIYLFSVSKNGISAKELERHLGVTYKTAWRMAKQIRLLMKPDVGWLSGEVEVDETYIGGKHKQRYGKSKKQIVFGMAQRKGRIKANIVKSNGTRVLIPEIIEHIERGSLIHSDEHRPYTNVTALGYSHTSVKHSKLEYVRENSHTNTVEGFWGQLKSSICGTYHGVSPKYLQSYVDEFAFRYNHRDVAVGPVLLDRALKPVGSVA